MAERQGVEIPWRKPLQLSKLPSTKYRNTVLTYLVIFLYIIFVCHFAILVEGKPSPQLSVIDKEDSELSDLFSERIDEGGDYYYDEGDDPYGILNDGENLEKITSASILAPSGITHKRSGRSDAACAHRTQRCAAVPLLFVEGKT